MQNSIVRVALVTAGILLIPLIASQASNEWNWTLSDFVIIGVLISGTGFMIELVRNKVRNNTHRTVLVVALVLASLYDWAELAVGIFLTWGS